MNTKVNLIMPVKSGESPMMNRSSNKLFKNGAGTNMFDKFKGAGEIGSFSERLKEISQDNRITLEPGPKFREPDAGLNPVKPRLEKQGGVTTPVYSDKEGVADKGLQPVTEISSDAASDMAVDNGFSVQKPVSADNGQTDSELLRSFGYNVTAADEGNENLADVNNQSVLLQLQGIYAPAANTVNDEETVLDDVQGEGDNEEVELVQGVDTENKTSIVNPSDVSSEILTEIVKTEKTEEVNVPVQNSVKDDKTDKADKTDNADKTGNSAVRGKPIQAAALFKGSLEELFKQGEILFGDIITFKVTDKGIFIGGEGDSTEDLANLVDGDFLQKIFDVLSGTLENIDTPTVSDQFRQLLISAIQKAVSDMHDPVKKEEEYQEKLVEFLMKFVDAITGKDDEDDDKKVALESDDPKNKGDLLLQIVENLIEAAKKNADDDSKKDDYTAGIYISAFEIGLLNSEQGEETEADPTEAVEQVSNVENSTNSTSTEKEPVHKAVENAVDVTEVNGERTVRYSAAAENNTVYSDTAQQNVVYPEEKVEAVFENAKAFADVDAVGQQAAVNADAVEAVNVNADAVQTVNVQKTENVDVENVQSVNFDNVYQVVQPAETDGKSSQGNTDSKRGTAASISTANRYGHKVRDNTDEVDELKRLFGIKSSRDDKKMKEKNDILDSKDEDGEETKTGVDENQGAVKAIGENTDEESTELLEGIDKSIIESVTLEAIKADNTAVAKGFTPDENGAKQIAAQIISEMLNNLSDGTRSERTVTTLTMTLNPESLGKITMKVSEEAGKISLMVTAHNKETAEILTQRMEAMQQAAKDSGTQLEKYQVVYGPEQDSRAGQQNYDGSSKNPYVRQDAEETQKDESGSQFADFLKQQAV